MGGKHKKRRWFHGVEKAMYDTAFDAPKDLRRRNPTVAVYPDAENNFEAVCRLSSIDPREACNMAHPAHAAFVRYRLDLGEHVIEIRSTGEGGARALSLGYR